MSPKPKHDPAFDWDGLFDQVEREVEANPEHPLLVGKPMGNPITTRAPWAPNPDDWETGVGRNTDRWERGIQAPSVDFKSAALAANGAWKAGVQQAVTEDRFAKGVQNVDVDAAVRTALAVGGAGWARGSTMRKAKYAAGVDAVRANMSGVVQKVRGMKADTPADRDQRALAMIQGARAAGKRAATRR